MAKEHTLISLLGQRGKGEGDTLSDDVFNVVAVAGRNEAAIALVVTG